MEIYNYSAWPSQKHLLQAHALPTVLPGQSWITLGNYSNTCTLNRIHADHKQDYHLAWPNITIPPTYFDLVGLHWSHQEHWGWAAPVAEAANVICIFSIFIWHHQISDVITERTTPRTLIKSFTTNPSTALDTLLYDTIIKIVHQVFLWL